MDSTSQPLNYNDMLYRALQGILRDALQYTAEHGLFDDHHFYICFSTTHPGVQISDHLKNLYPSEINIVLQNRFQDLSVNDQGFSVVLSFSSKLEYMFVPWDCVLSFSDPSVNFALQFETRYHVEPQHIDDKHKKSDPQKSQALLKTKKSDELNDLPTLDKTDSPPVTKLKNFKPKKDKSFKKHQPSSPSPTKPSTSKDHLIDDKKTAPPKPALKQKAPSKQSKNQQESTKKQLKSLQKDADIISIKAFLRNHHGRKNHHKETD
ncbi:MAG: ClpXP protease specificity-enhancing factor SspB [Pseudomonadota bacterium]